MKNKIWIGVVLFLLLVAICPVLVNAETKVVDSQKWQGGPLTWTVYDNGTLEITGNGEFKENKYYPWGNYVESITNVVIGNGVTNIPARAFQGMRNIKTVSLGNSVQCIGESAFNCCHALNEISIPASVVTIEKEAFCSCISLNTVRFSKNGKLREIGASAFEETGITAFSANDNLVSIGACAFLDCSALRSANLPDSLLTLGNYAFAGCDSLSWFRVGENVESIGTLVLDRCPNLEYLELNVPAQYTAQYSNFRYQKKLKCVILGGEWTELNQFCADCPELTTVVLPDSVKGIWTDSFSNCPKLTQINMPASLEHIGTDVFAGSGLTGVVLPDSVIYVQNGAFMGCKELRYFIGGDRLDEIGGYVLSNCPKLETVHLGNVEEIQVGALSNNPNLTNVIWSDKLERVGENVFDNCAKLPYAVFPASLTLLDSGAFGRCSALENVYFLGDAPAFGEERVFWDINVNAYYPQSNTTWTGEVMEQFADQLTWLPLCENHIGKSLTSVSPGCDMVGLSGGETCEACGLILAKQSVAQPTEHTFEKKIFNPDCTVAGFTVYTCDECGISHKDDIVAATAHQRSKWESIGNNQLQCKCKSCQQEWTRSSFFYVYVLADPNYKKPTVTQTVPPRPSTTTVQIPTTTEPVSTPPSTGNITTVPSTETVGGTEQIDTQMEDDVKVIAIMLLTMALICIVTMGALIYIKLTKKDEEE